MKQVLLILWQLPQWLVGRIFRLILRTSTRERYNDATVLYTSQMTGGISLGDTIVLDELFMRFPKTKMHEYGHVRQSKMLGWLYLPVIGLPSLVHACIHTLCGEKWDYYAFYTERWADKLGGVDRTTSKA